MAVADALVIDISDAIEVELRRVLREDFPGAYRLNDVSERLRKKAYES